MKLIIIGLGGIGSHLVKPLMQYLNFKKEKVFDTVLLVDGDTFEEKNKERQVFTHYENKASSTFQELLDYTKLNIAVFTEYITKDNIEDLIEEGDVVLSCVDNNATRLLLEQYLSGMKNLTIISGGNDLMDGNVNIIQRKEGMMLTPLLTELHPEVAEPTTKNPGEMNCTELAAIEGGEQISIVNASIADIMRRTLFAMMNGGIQYYEVYVDCESGESKFVKPKVENLEDIRYLEVKNEKTK